MRLTLPLLIFSTNPSSRIITSRLRPLLSTSSCITHRHSPHTTHHRLTLQSLNHKHIATHRNYSSASSTATATMSSLVESAKKSAATRAVTTHLLPHHRYIGIGSGSTAAYVVEAIVALGLDFYGHMTFIPTGSQSKGLIRAAGLKMRNLDERPLVAGEDGEMELVGLDVCFDGADEVDEELNL